MQVQKPSPRSRHFEMSVRASHESALILLLTHGRICLRESTTHATQQRRRRPTQPKLAPGDLFNLARRKDQHATLGRRLDPRPWDQALVKARQATAGKHGPERLHHRLRPVRRHLRLEDLERLAERGDLEHVHCGTCVGPRGSRVSETVALM